MQKSKTYLKLFARRLSNPVFFIMLLLAIVLWYVTKLSYTYTTQINIPVRIDSTFYSVRCSVEGTGYQLLMHKWAPRKNTIYLSTDNVAVAPSAVTAGSYEISSFTLQNAISTKVSDLKILEVESPVEIMLPNK